MSGSQERTRSIAILTIAAAMGGMERHSVELAITLARRGHAVRLVELGAPVLQRNPDLAAAGIEPLHVRMPHGVKRTSGAAWRRWLDELGAELVILAKGTVTVGSLALDRAAASGGRTYLTIEHCAPPPLPPAVRWRLGGRVPAFHTEFVRRPVRYWLRSLAPHRIICVSGAVRDALVGAYGFPAARMIVARNGTDVTRFVPDADVRRTTRVAWSVPKNATVIGSVARFNRVKGLDELIRVFAKIRASTPGMDLRLVLVGDGPEQAALRARAAESGAGEAILFPGAADAPETVYPAFDVFALSSRAEGLPLALLEAMSCAVPAVAYGVGGVGEVLDATSGGWLVPAGDAARFERDLAAAVTLPAPERHERAARARARIVDGFDVRESMVRLAAVIESAAATRS